MSNFVKVPIIILVVLAILVILFLVAIPAFLRHRTEIAPSKVIPAVSTIASSTSFLENQETYENTAYGYSFLYPAEHTPYSDVTSAGVLIPATSTSRSVSLARNESQALSGATEILRVRAYPEVASATEWIDTYYPDKSKIVGNKILLFGGFRARDVVSRGGTTTPTRVMVVQTPKGIVTIEQNQNTEWLNVIFASVKFGNAGRWVPIEKKRQPTRAALPEPTQWIPLATSTRSQVPSGTRTGKFISQEFGPAGASFMVPTDYEVKRVSVLGGVAYEVPAGNIMVVSQKNLPTRTVPPLLIFYLDNRVRTVEEWYLNYYDDKSHVLKAVELKTNGYRTMDIMGASTLTSPYRTRVIEKNGAIFVAIETVKTSIFDYILSTLKFNSTNTNPGSGSVPSHR